MVYIFLYIQKNVIICIFLCIILFMIEVNDKVCLIKTVLKNKIRNILVSWIHGDEASTRIKIFGLITHIIIINL